MKFNFQKEAFRPAIVQAASQRGIALVITLIMLSVTLVMAVAFLAVAQRERATVSISTDSVNARLATEAALAAAQAQILANVVGSGNGMYNFQLLVSTNYINYNGFVAHLANNPTNVNYDYYNTGPGPLAAADFEQNVANLQYQPRAPVMISATEPTGRFYLDLNRNGIFDATGPFISYVGMNGVTNGTAPQVGDPQWIGVLERPDSLHSVDNKFVYRYAFIAVPIGNALDINYLHNQVFNQTLTPADDGFFRNQGVGPWEINLAAFLADLNTNQWLPGVAPDNAYYSYNEPGGSFNDGIAFNDAEALLSWRYGFNYDSLTNADAMFTNAATIFPYDNIDEYSHGPLQITTTNIIETTALRDNPALAWVGANNTNRFFTPDDFYDRSKTQFGFSPTVKGFTDRLNNAGTNTYNNPNKLVPSYDNYTFYRMLAQLGTDSTADDADKIDLNYSNAVAQFNEYGVLTNTAIISGAQTNLVAWNARQFFVIAADRMLRMYTTNWFQSNPSNFLATYYGIPNYSYSYSYTNSLGNYITVVNDPNGFGLTNVPFFGMTNQIPAFGISHIPVFVNNTFVYSSAINRVLQLAANMYDASTNAPYPAFSFYPSVFRPSFTKDVFGNVFITGYTNITLVSGVGDYRFVTPTNLSAIISTPSTFTNNGLLNIYGVPWIIGAKKGMPNFNQFYMQNNVQITRKLQVIRAKSTDVYNGGASGNSGDYKTNELFIMNVTNNIGYSLWNSYTTNYPGQPTIFVYDNLGMGLTNGVLRLNASTNFSALYNNIGMNGWQGSAWNANLQPSSRAPAGTSFYYGNWSFGLLPASVYNFSGGYFTPLNDIPTPTFDTNVLNLPNLPQFGMMITNNLQAFILDNGHVIDYVQFGGPNSFTNLNNELADAYSGANNTPYQMWYTNASGKTQGGPSLGIANQIYVSRTGPSVAPATPTGWIAPANMPAGLTQTPTIEAAFFSAFFTGGPIISGGQTYYNTNLVQQAPFTPTRTLSTLTLWQANDPLVHYLASDLTESNAYTGLVRSDDPVTSPLPIVVQNQLGQSGGQIGDDRYQPWGVVSQLANLNEVDKNPYNLAYRDPLVYGSDNWDFPDNRYPSVGWLGRVHRGTPWQTVYMKATNINDYVNTLIPASGQYTWMVWSGNSSPIDAYNTLPVQDNQLFDLFTTALDDNASRGTLSVNQTGLAAWSAVLSGVDVISNATEAPSFAAPPLQANMVINPAGVDTNSPVWQIVNGPNGINATRTNLALFGNQAFSHIGHILLVPALTEHSPFLNNSNSIQQDYGVSDEMYERIPQQVMGLLRLGSPRYVIYCYGQALRPAQDGTALDANYFGLVTNYQVVAESVSRAVVSVHPQLVYLPPNAPTTNYTTTVESYTVLPTP